MIYCDDRSSSSYSFSLSIDVKEVNIENYEFDASLISYLYEKFDGETVGESDVLYEIRMYNAEMKIFCNESEIFDALVSLGYIKNI